MKIAIIGYGKMGHMIEEVARERGHEIVGVIDPTLAGSDLHQPSVISFESEAFRSADVAIEFTTPATAEENIRKAWAQGVPVISGSTGWKPEELKIKNYELKIKDNKTIITDETGKVMLVWSSNFSVGVNIFFGLNKWLAQEITNYELRIKNYELGEGGYTPSIREIHHIHKLDKPSGTAVAIANQIAMVHTAPLNGQATDGSALPTNVKFAGSPIIIDGIPIESIREGEVPGTHEVRWDSGEDTIVITHIAKGRRGFALGAVLAAEQIVASQR